MSDVSGRICVITGANTGIGRATAVEMAARGAKVVLACRSQERTQPVIDEIAAAHGDGAVSFLGLDLGDLADVRRAAAELLDRGDPIHILIANAGVAGQRGITASGFELHFGINHVGHFLFTTLLLDRLRESAPARVVVVSSNSHYGAKQGIPWDLLQQKTRSVTGLKEYEVSKLANVLFASELARREADSGVTVYSLHPGVIASDIWRRMPWPVRPVMKKFMKSPEEGAQTSLYCATAPELADQTGQYYDDCKQRKPSRKARDEGLAAELWQRSESWVS